MAKKGSKGLNMVKEGGKELVMEMARLLRAKRGSIASLAVSSLRDSQEAQYRLRLAIENRKYEIMKQKEPKRPNKPEKLNSPEKPESLEVFKEFYRIGRTNLPHQFRKAE